MHGLGAAAFPRPRFLDLPAGPGELGDPERLDGEPGGLVRVLGEDGAQVGHAFRELEQAGSPPGHVASAAFLAVAVDEEMLDGVWAFAAEGAAVCRVQAEPVEVGGEADVAGPAVQEHGALLPG